MTVTDEHSRPRSAILKAMTESCARLGYQDATVARILEESRVARSTFYAHFNDREDCFLRTMEILGEQLFAQIEEAVGPAGPDEAIGSAIEVLVAFAEINPVGAKLLFGEDLAAGTTALQTRSALMARIDQLLWGAAERDRPVEVGPGTLIGGVFRLLAMRMRHGRATFTDLGPELGIWIGSYAAQESFDRGDPQRSLTIAPVAIEGIQSLAPPPPLLGGRRRVSSIEVANGQRLRILAAVADCSFERGYAEVRVADITSRAQISRKAFYGQFCNLREAAAAAEERIFQAAIGACAGAFFSAKNWPERVWAGGHALLSFFALNPTDAHLAFVEPHAIGPATVQHVYDRLDAFTLFLEEGYRYRPEAEHLPKVCSEALAAAMFELAYREVRDKRNLMDLLSLLPQLIYMILAPFMGPKAAAEFVAAKVASDSA